MTRVDQQDIAGYDPTPELSQEDIDDLAVIDELFGDSIPYTVLETDTTIKPMPSYEKWRYTDGS